MVEKERNPERVLEQLLSAMPEELSRFRQLCEEVGDWDHLLDCARRNGVENLIHHYVFRTGFRLPPAIEQRAQPWQTIKDLWHAHAQSALEEALRVLDAASIRTVALKGPILGDRLYPDPKTRFSADLDLLVAANDLERAISALKAIGYGPAKESEARFLRKYHYHINLSRSCPPLIELHFRLSDRFGVETPAEEFLSRAGVYQRGRGPAAYILSPEDEMLYLCVHAAGHRFERLSWLYDIKLFLLRYPDLDWNSLTERARSLRLRTPLLFACETLRARLGVRTPLDEAMPGRLRSRVANFLVRLIARQPDPSRRSLLGKMAFTAVLCDRPADSLQFLQRQMLLVVRRRASRHFPSLTPEEWSY